MVEFLSQAEKTSRGVLFRKVGQQKALYPSKKKLYSEKSIISSKKEMYPEKKHCIRKKRRGYRARHCLLDVLCCRCDRSDRRDGRDVGFDRRDSDVQDCTASPKSPISLVEYARFHLKQGGTDQFVVSQGPPGDRIQIGRAHV